MECNPIPTIRVGMVASTESLQRGALVVSCVLVFRATRLEASFFNFWVELYVIIHRDLWHMENLTGYRRVSNVILPIIISVVCPTGPHRPIRLARRPNRGHIGGGGWTPS